MENNSESVVEQRLRQLRKDKAALLRGDKRLQVFKSLPSAIDPATSREELLKTNDLLLAIVRELKSLVTDQHRVCHNNVDELIACLKYIKQLIEDDDGDSWKRGD